MKISGGRGAGDMGFEETSRKVWEGLPKTLLTDSELVPRGKGEKNPGEGSEIVPETVCLQAVGALCPQGNA